MPEEGFGRRMAIMAGLLLFGVCTVFWQFGCFHLIYPHLYVERRIDKTLSEVIAAVGSLAVNVPLLFGAAIAQLLVGRRKGR
jgi:hypothetical protein